MDDASATPATPAAGKEVEVAPVRPGEELDWPALEAYLREHIDGLDGPFSVLQFPNGSANLTYLRAHRRHRAGRAPPAVRPPRPRRARHAPRVPRAVDALWQALRPGRRGPTCSATTTT